MSNKANLDTIPEETAALAETAQQPNPTTSQVRERELNEKEEEQEVNRYKHGRTRSGRAFRTSNSIFTSKLSQLIRDNKNFDSELIKVLDICESKLIDLETSKKSFQKSNDQFKSNLGEFSNFTPLTSSSPEKTEKPSENNTPNLLDFVDIENAARNTYQECLNIIHVNSIIEEKEAAEKSIILSRSLIFETSKSSLKYKSNINNSESINSFVEELESYLEASEPRNRLSLGDELKKLGETNTIFKLFHNLIDSNYITKMNKESVVRLVSSLVPEFYGNSNPGELQAFLGCCRQVSTCLTEDQQPLLLSLLATKLRGNAYLVMQNKTYSTIEEFEKILKNHFKPRKTYIQMSNELRQCSQLPTETLDLYILRVTNLLALCKEAAKDQYPNDAESLAKDLELAAAYSIKSGVMNPFIRQCMLMSTEKTLAEISEKMLRLELENSSNMSIAPSQLGNLGLGNLGYNLSGNPSQFGFHHSIHNVNNNPYINSLSPKFSPMFQSEPYIMGNNLQNFVKPNDKSNFNPLIQRPILTCSFCNKNNHSIQQCRIRKNTPFCVGCKTYGHNINNCSLNQNPAFSQRQKGFTGKNNASIFSTNAKQESRQQKRYNRTVKCDFCLRSGHEIEDCFTKRRRRREEKTSSQERKNQ